MCVVMKEKKRCLKKQSFRQNPQYVMANLKPYLLNVINMFNTVN